MQQQWHAGVRALEASLRADRCGGVGCCWLELESRVQCNAPRAAARSTRVRAVGEGWLVT